MDCKWEQRLHILNGHLLGQSSSSWTLLDAVWCDHHSSFPLASSSLIMGGNSGRGAVYFTVPSPSATQLQMAGEVREIVLHVRQWKSSSGASKIRVVWTMSVHVAYFATRTSCDFSREEMMLTRRRLFPTEWRGLLLSPFYISLR